MENREKLPDIERLLNIAMLGNVSVEFILYCRKKLISKSGVCGKFPELPLYTKAREFIQPTNQNLQQAFQGNLFFKTGNGNFDQYSEQ